MACPTQTGILPPSSAIRCWNTYPRLDDVLAEVARVLQPGGRFIFCVPGDRFTELLLFTSSFAASGWKPWLWHTNATLTASRGITTAMVPEVWQDRLEAAGLQLDDCFYYFSARATHALDLGHYFGAPSLVAEKLFGRWILAPSRWNLALTERWLRPFYEEPLPETGAYLFLVAQSP